jgi:hypothetical protein
MQKLLEFEKEEAEIERVLGLIGFKRKRIAKDGSCLFRCISDFLGLVQKFNHEIIRNEIMDYILENREFFEGFIDETISEYCKRMRNLEEWGGQLELEAAAQKYNIHIVVYSTNGICAEHHSEAEKKLNLSYIHGNHYDIAYTEEYFGHLEYCQSLVYDIVSSLSTITTSTSTLVTPWIYFNIEYEEWKEKSKKKKKKNQKEKSSFKKMEPTTMVTPISVWNLSNEEMDSVKSSQSMNTNQNIHVIVTPNKEIEKEKKKEPEKKKKPEYQRKEWEFDQLEDDFSNFISKFKNKMYDNILVLGTGDRKNGFALKIMKSTNASIQIHQWLIFDIFGEEFKKKYRIGKPLDVVELFHIFDKSLFSKHRILGISKEELNEIYNKIFHQ